MTQDQVISMLHKVIAEGPNFTTWTVSTPHLVALVNQAIEAEREACEAIEYDLAKSPAMFSTMAEYKAYKDGVQDYRAKIIARGEA